ncbi:MAG: ATP-binding protein, partial [Holophagales bacterium]|nr:ATP-binding protein [Holophagales bacterium]
LLLMVAASVGLTVSNRLMSPISSLIDAAHKVGKGDLKARAEGAVYEDELGLLTRSFNRMTEQLETQRAGLMAANRELDERRRFTEAVLAGVSAGVIGLDGSGAIDLPNRAASALLDVDLETHRGEKLVDLVPAMGEVMAVARRRTRRRDAPVEVTVSTRSGPRTLVVNVTAERSGKAIHGYVVTFDDVTDLLTAQRKAAWADVARRIAHEIKNPLTPIQLTAERLLRKHELGDPGLGSALEQGVVTIVREVESLKSMVDEFSRFARMPQPRPRPVDLAEVFGEVVRLHQDIKPGVSLHARVGEGAETVRFDPEQLRSVLINLVDNAIQATDSPGEVSLVSARNGRSTYIHVADTGRGIKAEDKERVFLPYFSTKGRGTGLGLSIVHRIVSDHHGHIHVRDNVPQGAIFTLEVPTS